MRIRRAILLAAGMALVVGTAAGQHTTGAVADPYAPPPKAPAPPPPPTPGKDVKRFSHVDHAAFSKLDVANCRQCHGLGADQKPLTPGQDGHQPCMSSGCHMQDFLNPETKFCLGCHATTDNYKKNPTVDVYYQDPSPEHHVEVDHAAHMKRGQPGNPQAKATCQTCHWVDKATYEAVTHPGHPQCAPCHASGNKVPMTACERCHPGGAPQVTFTKVRPDAQLNHAFLHERANHRFFDPDKKTKPMQCDLCHAKMARLTNLTQVFGARVVDARTMNGTCARCHDVKDTRVCTKCHTRGTVIQTLDYHVLDED